MLGRKKNNGIEPFFLVVFNLADICFNDSETKLITKQIRAHTQVSKTNGKEENSNKQANIISLRTPK